MERLTPAGVTSIELLTRVARWGDVPTDHGAVFLATAERRGVRGDSFIGAFLTAHIPGPICVGGSSVVAAVYGAIITRGISSLAG